jgi:transcriptional regulator with XRE-family HTH domain
LFPTLTRMGMTGDDLRQARKHSGLTQGALGARAGVTARQWRNWEDLDTLPAYLEERVTRALRGDEPEVEIPAGMWEMTNLGLIAQLQQIVAVLAVRLDERDLGQREDEPTPTGGLPSAPDATPTYGSTVPPTPARGNGVITGKLGKRDQPRSEDREM